MGGRAEGLACADLGARTPIGVSGNYYYYYSINKASASALWGTDLKIGSPDPFQKTERNPKIDLKTWVRKLPQLCL